MIIHSLQNLTNGHFSRQAVHSVEPRTSKNLFKAGFLPTAFRLALIPVFFLAVHVSSQAQNCSVNSGVAATFCPDMQIPLIGGTAGSIVPNSFYWTQISGPAVIIDDPTMLMSTVTGYMGGNSYKFRAYLTCEDGSLVFQDVNYTVLVVTPAMAGPDISGCPGTYFLSANNPGVGELGIWTVVGTNNGVTISDPQDPNSPIVLANGNGGQTVLRWSITNGNGCASHEDVLVTNCGGVQPVNAGPDQNLGNCYSLTTMTCLNATPAGYCGTGTWSVVSGPNVPTIVNNNAANTCISNLIEGCYVFRWVVAGQCANGEDEVMICVPAPTQDITPANSGSQTFCDNRTSTFLYGSIPLYTNETVQWVQTGGPPATIVSPTTPVTEVTGLDGMSSYSFSYTITNPITGCSSTGNFTIIFDEPGSMVDITTDDPIIQMCDDKTVTLTYTHSGPGAVQWRIAASPTGILTDWAAAGSSPFTIFELYGPGNPVPPGVYILEMRKDAPVGAGCSISSGDQVTVVFSSSITGANAGTNQELPCATYSSSLIGNLPFIGSGTWSQVSGPGVANILEITANNSDVIFPSNVNGAYVLRWTVSGGPACDAVYDDVVVRVTNQVPTNANAGADQTVCINTPVYLMGSTPQPSDIGTWTVTPNAGVVISDIHDPKAVVTGLAGNTVYTFTWTVKNTCGMASDNVVITTNNSDGPDIANAGPDQCLPAGTTSITLAGNNPSVGTGLWTKISTIPANLPATIVSPTLFNTVVNGLSNGTYYFEWQNLNGSCTPTRDTVIITISAPVSTAAAGADQEICGTSATMAANAPLVGAGKWTQASGPGGAVITNPLSPTTTITGLTDGVYKFAWTITNGACSSTDTVKLFVSLPPTPADAGPDQMICGATSTTLAANAVADGYWTVVSGPNAPTFSNTNSPTSMVSGLVFGTYVLKWNSKSGPFCPVDMDEMMITLVPSANAGPDQSFCEETMSVNLVGNANSVGTWTLVSGTPAPTITMTSDNTATASGLMVPGQSNVYEFKYTINQLGCMSMDNMLVTLFMPPNEAMAGLDQEACDLTGMTTYTLAGNNPVPPYVGTWSVLAGPGGSTFTPNANTPNAVFDPGGYGVYLLAWSISNGACSRQDQVRITNYQPPSTGMAGPDQTVVCDDQVTMAAVNPVIGLGMWTVISKPMGAPDPVIASPILYNTVISNLVPGTYVFRWTTTNGLCPESFDEVSITILEQPTPANAGTDQIFCNMNSTTLDATPVVIGTGLWTIVTTPGGPFPTFVDATDPKTVVNGLSHGTYVFRWTTTNAPCTSMDEVTIKNDANPTTADVSGTNTSLCYGSPMFLVGNTPLIGTGVWTQTDGNPTFILNPNNPTTQVIGFNVGQMYTFRWTITNGSCPASFAEVTITVNPFPSQLAYAGPSQIHCDVTTAVLNGNVPLGGETGTWTLFSGPNPVTFTNADEHSAGATVNGLVGGNPNIYVLQWEVAVVTCTTKDTMTIVVWAPPTPANAGPDQELCNFTTFQLSATPVTVGTGMWTKVSGPAGTITNPLAAVTTVTGTVPGTYVFRWTTVNGMICPPSIDEVTIINRAVIAAGGPTSISVCIGATPILSSNATGGSGSYTYQWQESPGDCSAPAFVNIPGATGPNYTTPILTTTTSYRVIITDANSVCSPYTTPCATVTVVADPNITVQPIDAIVCNGGTNTLSVTATGGTPSLMYQWQVSDNDCNAAWTDIAGATFNSYTTPALTTTKHYRVIVSATGLDCNPVTSACATITVVADPVITTQPLGATFCNGGTHTMTVVATFDNNAGPISYQWQIATAAGGPFTDISGANASSYTITINATRYYRVVITQPSSGCQVISAEALVTIFADPTITVQPVPATVCVGGNANLSVTATGGVPPLIYAWESSSMAGGPWSPAVGINNLSTYNTGVLTTTTFYRVRVSSAGPSCDEVISTVVAVTVVPDPVISTQPMGTTICVGGTSTLSVTATASTPNIAYQWQISDTDCNGNWSNIPGAVASSYTPILPPGLTVSKSYRVIITSNGSDCSTISDCATINVVDDPVINVQPVGATVCFGGTHTMSVTATGNVPPGALLYQWQVATFLVGPYTNIAGATSSTFTTTINATRFYRVLVTQGTSASGCSTTSGVAQVIFVADPSISAHPSSATVCVGGNANLSVTALGGTPALDYQWEFSTVSNVGPWTPTGANSNSLNTGVLTITTYYRVLVSASGEGCGTATSNVATVTVVNDPTINTQPANTTVCVGGTPTLSVAASGGTPTLSYQWQVSSIDCNGTWSDIAGANSNMYITPAQTVTSYYRVLVSATGSDCNTATSNCAIVTVVPDPVIDIQPVGATICAGGTHSMSVSATGNPLLGPLSYQWQSSATSGGVYTNISGANAATYMTPVLNTPGSYFYKVLVSQAPSGCSVLSNFAEVVVLAQQNAAAGADQNICYNQVTSTTLFGNTPSHGSGLWTQVSGPFGAPAANIQNPNNPSTLVTGLTDLGNYVFRWTITNAPCLEDFDEVTITVEDCCVPPQTYAITLKACAMGVGMAMAEFDFAALHADTVTVTDGSANVTFEFNLENFGNVNLNNLTLTDDLAATFPATCAVSVMSLTSDDFIVDPAFNGTGMNNMLAAGNDLPVGDKGAVLLTVNVANCGIGQTDFVNTATTTGTAPGRYNRYGRRLTDLILTARMATTTRTRRVVLRYPLSKPVLGLAKRNVQTVN
jgi:hypothetical protein